MTDRPNPAAVQNFVDVQRGASSPVIYAEIVAAYGVSPGMIGQIELCASFLTPLSDGSTKREIVSVAKLRLTMPGLAALKEAISGIEMMLAPSDAKPN